MFGTLSFFNQELLFIASQDILSGRKLPTATILVCFVTPLMITKILAPWFVQRIPYVVKTCIIALDMALGLTLIVFVENMEVKLLGICLNAMATGSAEVVFLGLSSFYQPICISSYVAGTGMASLFSPLYYNGKKILFAYILNIRMQILGNRRARKQSKCETRVQCHLVWAWGQDIYDILRAQIVIIPEEKKFFTPLDI